MRLPDFMIVKNFQVVRTSSRGRIRCILENMDTGERRLFQSEASASRFLGRSKAYLASVRLRGGGILTTRSGEEYFAIYPGYRGIDGELPEDDYES